MHEHSARGARQPAVAGLFYPGERAALKAELDELLAAADAPDIAPPKALITPHAGYGYSGPVAATAYGAIARLRGRIRRIVLIGPSHYLAYQGLAAPSSRAFVTPLGEMAVARGAIARLVERGLAVIDDEPHFSEHALEVQLPFLKAQLGGVELVPLLVGDASAEAVAAALEALWGGPETLIVVSSDLSHYHAADAARRLDGATAAAIERFDGAALDIEDACGFQAIAGLLLAARTHGLAPVRLDLRTSADTAGPMERVVGYGAWSFAAPLK